MAAGLVVCNQSVSAEDVLMLLRIQYTYEEPNSVWAVVFALGTGSVLPGGPMLLRMCEAVRGRAELEERSMLCAVKDGSRDAKSKTFDCKLGLRREKIKR